jgi:hypothetical protein
MSMEIHLSKGLVKLVADLEKYKPDGWKDIKKEAMNGDFSDFESEYDSPVSMLMLKLSDETMKTKASQGEYDHDRICKC